MGTAASSSPGDATPPAGTREVTLADDGSTLILSVGEHFLLALGWDHDWRVEVSDSPVVGRIINIAVVRGAQGVYEAREPGETDLVATGVPTCRSANPPCDKPDRTFRIHLVIKESRTTATPTPP